MKRDAASAGDAADHAAPSSLPPIVRRLGAVSLLTDAASEMIYPLLPAFLLALGGGATSLGWMEGVAESTNAFVQWLAGAASDRRGRRKPFVVVGYAVASLARPLLGLVTAPWQVVALRSVDRTGKGLRSAPRDAMLAHAVPRAIRGRAYGYHRMMDNAGSVVGALLAFSLVQLVGLPLRTVFLLAFVPGLLAVATLVVAIEEPPEDAGLVPAKPEPAGTAPEDEASMPVNGAGGAKAGPASAAELPSAARRYLLAVGLFTLGGSADSFLLLHAQRLGLAAGLAPIVWLALSALRSLANVPGGRLADRFGRRRTLVAGWALYTISYGAFAGATSLGSFLTVLVLYGLHYGFVEGSARALLVDYAGDTGRGRAFGAYYAVSGLAVLPANAGFGLLYAVAPPFAFGAGAVIAALSVVTLVWTRDPPAT